MNDKTKIENRVCIFFWIDVVVLMVPATIMVLPSRWLDTSPNGGGGVIGSFFVSLIAGIWIAFIMAVSTFIHRRELRKKYRIMGLVPIMTLVLVAVATVIYLTVLT